MLIRWSELKKLPVFTKLGLRLGRVSGMELDIDNHLVRAYFVRKDFLSDELSIARSQVISIDKDKMVVEDGAVKEAAEEAARAAVREEAAPISMSELEN